MEMRKILCPVDLAPASGGVLKAALASARAYGADVWVLHVNDAIGPRGRLLPPWSPRVLESPARDRLVLRVRELIRQAGGSLREGVAVRHGEPAREIVRYARSLRPDLIVMGMSVQGSALEAPSITETVAGFVAAPVLCVPAEGGGQSWARPPRHIMCATDFSSAARRAADLALALARRSRGRLTLVHVLPADGGASEPGARAAARTAEIRMKALWPADVARRADIEYVVTPGPVDAEIAAAAGRARVDLVVVGRRAGAPLGPLVRAVIRESGAPVLVGGASIPSPWMAAAGQNQPGAGEPWVVSPGAPAREVTSR